MRYLHPSDLYAAKTRNADIDISREPDLEDKNISVIMSGIQKIQKEENDCTSISIFS